MRFMMLCYTSDYSEPQYVSHCLPVTKKDDSLIGPLSVGPFYDVT